MIETFVTQRITEPGQWYDKIPQYLRTGTNPVEKMRFLESICEIIERVRNKRHFGGQRYEPRRRPFANLR